MRTGGIVALAVAGLVVIGGGAALATTMTGNEPTNTVAASETPVETETAEPETVEPTEADEDAEALTAPGAVCDPNSMNTIECSVDYPEIGYLNAVNRTAVEPLISLSDIEKLELAHEACTVLDNGGDASTIIIATTAADYTDTWNNGIVFTAAPLGFCHEHADQELIAPFVD